MFIAGLVLPLVKTVGALLLWFLPTTILSTSKRLKFISVLNELSKFDIARECFVRLNTPYDAPRSVAQARIHYHHVLTTIAFSFRDLQSSLFCFFW